MSKSHSLLRLIRRRASKLSSASSTCQTKLATTYICQKSARCLATVNAGPKVLPDIWFTGSKPQNEDSLPNPKNSNKPPNNERTVKLGKSKLPLPRSPSLYSPTYKQYTNNSQLSAFSKNVFLPSSNLHFPKKSSPRK